MTRHQRLLREAVRLAEANLERGGRPFGAVLAIDGAVVATGVNDIVASHDPTTHAEMQALRAASRRLGRPDLKGSVVYASGHPCPMCVAAMVMAGIDAVYYAFDNDDAAPYGLSSESAYRALRLPLEPPPLPLERLDTGVTAADLYGKQRGEPRAIECISAVTLGTRDMTRAVPFYEALGFTIRDGGSAASFTSFEVGDATLNLIATEVERRWPWWGRVIFYVADVDTFYRHAIAQGLHPDFAPRDASWNERYFHIVDPDGHELSFAKVLG